MSITATAPAPATDGGEVQLLSTQIRDLTITVESPVSLKIGGKTLSLASSDPAAEFNSRPRVVGGPVPPPRAGTLLRRLCWLVIRSLAAVRPQQELTLDVGLDRTELIVDPPNKGIFQEWHFEDFQGPTPGRHDYLRDSKEGDIHLWDAVWAVFDI